MKVIRFSLVICMLAMIAGIGGNAQTGAARQPASPEGLVSALYKAHDSHHSPFFQTRSRLLVDKYFDRTLANLIWADARSSKGEVGALDGDPLYNAQDIEIKNFKVGQAQNSSTPSKAEVPVTFTNLGEKKNLTFMLTLVNATWKISDIKYEDGTTLKGLLKGQG